MPYRRLPNTDSARLQAMEGALKKGNEIPPFQLAFSPATLQRLKAFYPIFMQTIMTQRQSYSLQLERHKEYAVLLKRAKLYISHFIQVLNLAIIRGELPALVKEYYGLPVNCNKTLLLTTENHVIEWGKKVIEGEHKRITKGGTPLTNPTIAVVKVHYEKFIEAYRNQKSLITITSRTQSKILELRKQADEIILAIWNEVERSFNTLPPALMREKAKEYGVAYVLRKSEIQKQYIKENYEMQLAL